MCRFVAYTTPQTTFPDDASSSFKASVSLHERFKVLLHSWPHAVNVRVFELLPPQRRLGLTTRIQLAEVSITVPGEQGTPAAQAFTQGYVWTSPAQAALPAFDSGFADGRAETLQAVTPAGVPF